MVCPTPTFVCGICGGTFPFEAEKDAAKWEEAKKKWGDVPMAIVCDACGEAFHKWAEEEGIPNAEA